MDDLILFLEQIALYVLGAVVLLQTWLVRHVHTLDKRTSKMEPRPDSSIPMLDRVESRLTSCEDRLDRGTTKIDKLGEDIQALRADVSRILGILERKG